MAMSTSDTDILAAMRPGAQPGMSQWWSLPWEVRSEASFRPLDPIAHSEVPRQKTRRHCPGKARPAANKYIPKIRAQTKGIVPHETIDHLHSCWSHLTASWTSAPREEYLQQPEQHSERHLRVAK